MIFLRRLQTSSLRASTMRVPLARMRNRRKALLQRQREKTMSRENMLSQVSNIENFINSL